MRNVVDPLYKAGKGNQEGGTKNLEQDWDPS